MMLPAIRCRLVRTTVAVSCFAAAPAFGQTINEYLEVSAADASASDFFGFSIAIDNGVVAVAAVGDDDNGPISGSAYLFDASTGAPLGKLLAGDGASGDEFGISIAVGSGIVAVGAPDDNDNGSDSGSAYLFDAATGTQIAKLLPDDGAGYDTFGLSIAIDNGVVAVGAQGDGANGSFSGSAYLFDASTGAQIAKLLPSDGAADDYFGRFIDIDNGVVAVGAMGDDDNGMYSGSAYLFDASTGAQLAKLLPSDGAAGNFFGHSIAIDNGIVAVGAFHDDDNGLSSGSAYLFDAFTGAQLAKLLPNDGATRDYFGYPLAIDNGLVAVGARGDDHSGSGSGSAYLFNASTGAQIAKLLLSDDAAGSGFPDSIAIDNGVVAVGAPYDDDHGSSSGSAYLFAVGAPCIADLTGDGVLDFFDVQAFLNAFAAKDETADFVDDGVFDFFDLQAFLQAFSAGCP